MCGCFSKVCESEPAIDYYPSVWELVCHRKLSPRSQLQETAWQSGKRRKGNTEGGEDQLILYQTFRLTKDRSEESENQLIRKTQKEEQLLQSLRRENQETEKETSPSPL